MEVPGRRRVYGTEIIPGPNVVVDDERAVIDPGLLERLPGEIPRKIVPGPAAVLIVVGECLIDHAHLEL